MKEIFLTLLATSFFHLSFSQESEILTIKNDSADIFLESLNIEVEVVGNRATSVTKRLFSIPMTDALNEEAKAVLNA